MTGRHPARPTTGPAPVTVTVETGEPRETWCTACKAFTRATGDVLVLTADGVATVGTWTFCDTCEDPADPEPRHG